MKHLIIRISFLLVFLLSVWVGYSAHIVGGDMVYKCQGFDGVEGSFEITMTLYRDTQGGGAQFDPQGRFGLFELDSDGITWNYLRTIDNINVQDVSNVTNVGSNPCLIIPPNIGVQKGLYKFVVNLPLTNTEYMIAYQRCCRNQSITNIVSPGDTGSVTSINISGAAISTCNDSPVFNEFPPIVICANQDVNFQHSATDPDGDVLVYSFCSPLASGGTDGSGTNGGDLNSCTGVKPSPAICMPPYDPVQFLQPTYQVFNPMGGSPQVSINANTGLISGIPLITGQFVVGICVEEFRGGLSIGKVRRDFQFNVTNCDDGVFANIEADDIIDGKNYVVNSCGDNVVNLVNTSGLPQFIDEYYWEFDIDGDLQTFNTRDITLTLPDYGTYTGVMQINNNVPASGCRDTAEVTVNLYPPILAEYTFDYDTCVAGPVEFTNLSSSGAGAIIENNWSFGDFNTSMAAAPSHTYLTPGLFGTQLEVVDGNNCRDTISYALSYFPIPGLLIVEPNSFVGCLPANIFFNNLSTPIDSSYDLSWDFGDGGFSGEISPFHNYENFGTYSVSLQVTSPIGCTTSTSFNDWITVEPSPTAAFDCTPEELSNFNSTLEITDQSEDAIDWFYTFGDGGISYDQDPFYTYQDTGVYNIMQVVRHESGCTDTLIKVVDVSPLVTLHMPNAFTPNNDGLNDDFRGKGYLPGIRNYTLSIWSRWGEKIFENNDPDQGWNGEYNNAGKQAMGGVYVYTVQYTGPRGNAFELKGNVTLIR